MKITEFQTAELDHAKHTMPQRKAHAKAWVDAVPNTADETATNITLSMEAKARLEKAQREREKAEEAARVTPLKPDGAKVTVKAANDDGEKGEPEAATPTFDVAA